LHIYRGGLHFFLLGINVKRECPAFDHVAIDSFNIRGYYNIYELITYFPSAMIRSNKIDFIEKIFS